MKLLNDNHCAEGRNSSRPLILSQRTAALGPDTPVVFQESCLGVSTDQSTVVLRRYFEHFSPTNAHWVEYVHSVNTADLMNWIMAHGRLHIECSDNMTQNKEAV